MLLFLFELFLENIYLIIFQIFLKNKSKKGHNFQIKPSVYMPLKKKIDPSLNI